jgi:hypothetical protein
MQPAQIPASNTSATKNEVLRMAPSSRTSIPWLKNSVTDVSESNIV